jgi:hypothetical protein
MLKRLPYLMLMFLALALAPLRGSPPIGAVVQTWRYDAAAQQVVVSVSNKSNKDITAFNLSVTERYADGTANSFENMTDYLPLVAVAANNGTFPAGTSRDVTLPDAKNPISVSIIVDMVAYADHTADVQNEKAFNHLVSNRKEIVLATQQANKAIKDALAAPNPKDAAVKELTRLANVAKAQGGGGITEMTLRGHIQSAQQSQDLAVLAKDGEARIAILVPHTQLVKGGQR